MTPAAMLRRLRAGLPVAPASATSADAPLRVVQVGASVDPGASAAVYAAAREVIVRSRFEAAVGLWFVCVGLVTLIERHYFPDRAATMTGHYLLDGVVCLVAVALGRLGIDVFSPRRVATLLMTFLVLRATTYLIAVGETVELLAMAQVTLLCGLMILIPWGWLCQLVVVASALLSFAAAIPHLHLTSVWFYSIVPLACTAVTTVLGAYLLDRLRHDHFLREAEQEERAERAATLGDFSEMLSLHLDQPDLPQHATRLAVEALGTDWSGLWVIDPERREVRFCAATGVDYDRCDRVADLALPPSATRLLEDLPADAVIEMPSPSEQALVSREALRSFDVASALIVPVRTDDGVLGAWVHAYRYRTGPFSGRQHHLALGLAHRTALALRNARVISELQDLSRVKSDFLSTMSHELRTPVNVIAGYVDLLREGAFGSLLPAQQETVARVRRKVGEMLELVNATLDVGRLESGREVIAADEVDLDQLFAELGVELEPPADSAVSLRWRRDVGDPIVRIDRAKVKLILKNLVGNALKFTPSGSIDITASRTADTLRVAVSDTGIGIAPTDATVIFEKFRQIDGGGRARQGGVGLGLYIVKRLVDLLGGTITVESTLGVGSIFTVEIPFGDRT